MATRADLHRLVDELPEQEWPLALSLLEGLPCGQVDPFLRVLALAPLDDEPETEEERAAIAEAEEDIRLGHTVSMDEIKREFGL